MDRAEIEAILTQALESLYEEDLQVIQLDVSERTICGQLRSILQRFFAAHAVHTEYNRHGILPKEIEMPNAEGALVQTRVFPDIIVHQPSHDAENLLVIEAKKSTNPIGDEPDLAKLAHMKYQLQYEHAVFIRLPTGTGAVAAEVRLSWV